MTRRAMSGATALSYAFWVLFAANIGLGALLFMAAPDAVSPAPPASAPGGRDACGASRPFANLRDALSHATRLDARWRARGGSRSGRAGSPRSCRVHRARGIAGRRSAGAAGAGGAVDRRAGGGCRSAGERGHPGGVRGARRRPKRSWSGWRRSATRPGEMALERANTVYVVLAREGLLRAVEHAPCDAIPGMDGAGGAVARCKRPRPPGRVDRMPGKAATPLTLEGGAGGRRSRCRHMPHPLESPPPSSRLEVARPP